MHFFDRFRKPASEPVPADPFSPGIYKYTVTYEDGNYDRLHLRVENDRTGILWINGNDSFYLNESASLFTWCVLTGKSDEDVRNYFNAAFGKDAEKAFADYQEFKPLIEDMMSGKTGAADLFYSGIDKVIPFSRIPDAPYRMDLALTYGCNNQCAHCYNEPGRGHDRLSLEQWKKVLDKLESIAIPHVVFTGGEPTTVPFLPELVGYADKLGIIAGLNTNGRKLKDEDLVLRLKEGSLDHVQITLESMDPEIHDRMVGVPGAWEETIAGIRNVVKNGMYMNTNTTLLASNSDPQKIEAFLNFLNDLGVRTFGMNALIRSGKGKEYENAISPEALPRILETVKTVAERNDQRFIWYTPTQYCVFDPQSAGLGLKSCTAAKFSMCIEPDGNVLPCQSWYEPVGNILTDPWEIIWENPLCRRLRYKEYMPAPCRACESLDLCTCGCPLEIESNSARIAPRSGIPECF